MLRIARVVIPGCPQHVTQRGNNRQDVFFVDDDRNVYLGLLGEYADRYGLEVTAVARRRRLAAGTDPAGR